MTRSLNRLALGLLVLMIALLVQLTRIQVFQRAELNAMPGNQRTLLTEYSRERGPILVDRAPIAESVATEDELKYLRTYPIGPDVRLGDRLLLDRLRGHRPGEGGEPGAVR